MRKIADAIEYSPTAIYFHFKDKEALIRELCVTDFRSLAAVITAITPGAERAAATSIAPMSACGR